MFVSVREERMGYGATARIVHWVMAVLVILMIAAGLTMTSDVERGLQDVLFIFHKSTGALLLLLVAFRIVWRLTHPAPPLPDSVPRLQQIAAHATHFGLYFFLVVMVVSGYVRVTTGGFPIELLNAVGIPPFLPRSESAANIAKSIHATAKYGLIVLILMHVGAAAFHGLVLRDRVFWRMWPPFARSPG
jgi:cytochrome b561